MRGKRILAWALAIMVVTTNSELVKGADIAKSATEVNATGDNSTISGNYTYTVNGDGKSCTITKYSGTEENVIIPETIDGYTVTAMDQIPFDSNTYVKNITVPKTVISMGTYGSYIASGAKNLENIYVNDANPIYYDVDGILYKKVNSGIILSEYPAGKQLSSFRIPSNVAHIGMNCFAASQHLQKVIIPSTVKGIHMGSFMYSSLSIYILNEDPNSYTIDVQSFYNMLSGTKVIVPNSLIKDKVNAAIDPVGDANVQVINLTEANATVKAQYTVPASSLTFADGTSSKNLTMSTGGTYSLLNQYTLSPADTTDNVRWSSDNTNVATVDSITGLVKAVALGTCAITGADDSGHVITENINVYQGIESVEMYCDSSNPSTYTTPYDSKNNTKWIGFTTTPSRASNWDQTVWSSSHPEVATVQKDNTNQEYALLTFLAPGSTTITATINDNGTIWTKSFILTVTKNLLNCSIDSITDQAYTGAEITPSINIKDGNKQLKEGTDYTLSYGDNKVGTGEVTATAIAGSGYEGKVSKSFTIKKADYDLSHVTWTTTNFPYTGSNQSVSLTGLPEGVTATYSNNVKSAPGTYTATATLSYDTNSHNKPSTIQYSTTWNIEAPDQQITFKNKSITNNSITVPVNAKTFNLGGKAKAAISYSGGNKVAVVDKKGNVTIKGTGYVAIVVTAKATASYKKTTTIVNVYVTPQKSQISSLKSSSKKTMTLQWNKDTKASGYQITYSTNSKFKGSSTRTVTVSKNKVTSQKIKNLTKGKKYYVKVRSYKSVNVNGQNVNAYGSWSSTQSVKIKK